MENFDWKRYLLFFAIAFGVFVVYDQFFASKQIQQTVPKNQTVESRKAVEPVRKAEVNLYLGTQREKLKPKSFITLDLKDIKVKIAKEGAKIVSAYDKRFKKELIEPYERAYNIYPLEVLTPDWETTKVLNFSEYSCKREGLKVTCSLKEGNIWATKTFVFTKVGYLAKVELELKGVKNPYLYLGMTPKERPFYTHIGPIVKTSKGRVIRIDTEDIKGVSILRGDFLWVGEEGRYFIKAANYNTHTAVFFRVSYLDEGRTEYTSASAMAIKPKAEIVFLEGPKEYELLKKVNFVEAIDFGILHLLAYPTFLVLYFFYKIFHSWVASIFLLTGILKLLFFPLMIKSTKSMKKMQELGPKLEEIRKRYAKDPQKMQQEIMKLYKEVGFNPMSGCLPMIVQIPVFFALYKVLIVTPDLALESFLWIPSLAEKDPYFILPVLMGLSMIAQSFVSPSPNKQHNFMMYGMAVVFTFLFATFPSGLVLYWTLNNILGVIQTWVIYKYMG